MSYTEPLNKIQQHYALNQKNLIKSTTDVHNTVKENVDALKGAVNLIDKINLMMSQMQQFDLSTQKLEESIKLLQEEHSKYI